MKNILSIDLDVLFPLLDSQLERFRFGGYLTESPTKFWNTVKNGGVSVEYFLSNTPYLLISSILTWIDLFKSNAHVHLIEKHQEILDIVGSHRCNIINIDQHHDIYYTEYQKEQALLGSKIDILESNWVLYLHEKGLLKNYSWVTNKTANFSFDHLQYPFCFYIEREWRAENTYGIEKDIKKKLEDNWFTDIVFCRSPHYCPSTEKVEKIITKVKSKDNYIHF